MSPKKKANKGTQEVAANPAQKANARFYIMLSFGVGLAALSISILVEAYAKPSSYVPKTFPRGEIPDQAQVIDQKAFNVLPFVPPATEANATTVRTA